MQPCKISVVIPAWNRAKTIKSCLDSVLNQTYQPFEVIVVDDGSTDDTVDIVKRIADPRIKLFVQGENLGAQVARNRGIKAATGDWIAFQDSDDIWLPQKLERQVAVLSKHNFDPYIVVHSDCFKVYPEEGRRKYYRLPEVSGPNAYALLLSSPGPAFPAILVSKQILLEIGLLDEALPAYQEWDTALSLARLCKFIHLREGLFDYYLHADLTISKNKKAEVLGYQSILNKFKSDIIKYCGQAVWRKHLAEQYIKFLRYELYKENWLENDLLKMLVFQVNKECSAELLAGFDELSIYQYLRLILKKIIRRIKLCLSK